MSGAAQSDVGDTFEALADANRRAILNLSGRAPLGAADRRRDADQQAGGVAASTCSGRSPGLVAEEREGTRHLFSLQEAGACRRCAQYLERVWGESAARFTLFAENTGEER
jgi:hypothetical protein